MPGQAKTIALIFIVFLFFAFLFPPVQAGASAITINEICWMGSENKTTDEWLELYNNLDSPVSLDNWILKIDDTEIKLKGVIFGQGFYLISRNKNMGANLISTKALKNTGNKISLMDTNKNIVEQLDWNKGWPAGDNKTKQTMEKINSLLSGENKTNWQTSADAGGTPKTKNSSGAVIKNSTDAKMSSFNSSSQPSFFHPGNKTVEQGSPSRGSILLAVFLSLFSGVLIFLLKTNIN